SWGTSIEGAGDRATDLPAGSPGRKRGLARRPQPHFYRRERKTATLAVNPWRKFLPATGPISPIAKKPDAGTSPSRAVWMQPMSWSGFGNIRVPRPLQEKTSAPRAFVFDVGPA